MDARGNIYRAPEDEIPVEDRERFDRAVLAGEVQRAKEEAAQAGEKLEVSRLLLQVATERERTAQAIRERDEALAERDEADA
jgi:hypothetical protein